MDNFNDLLEQYYKLFPNTTFDVTWFDIPDKLKIKILKDCIKSKQTYDNHKIYYDYMEKVIF